VSIISNNTLQFTNTFINTSQGTISSIQQARIIPLSASTLSNAVATATDLTLSPPRYWFTNIINLSSTKFVGINSSTSSSTFTLPCSYTTTAGIFNNASSYVGLSSIFGTGTSVLLGVLLLNFDSGAFQ
jgi:hypothetical protein